MLYGVNVYVGERDIRPKGHAEKQLPSGEWVTARELGYVSALDRLKCALKVLRGEADIVIWQH